MGERTWPNLLAALLRAEELSTADTAWAMGEIMSGEATPVQIAAFAIALRAKGETPAEIAGLVEAMLAHAARVTLPEEVRVSVVKHGNRAASSSCGAADLLEALGVPLDLGPAEVAHCVEQAGIGFCFAPMFHPGLRHAGVPRREMGVPTAFNFLGPLTNPAQPTAAAIGCADLRMAPVMAAVFARRGDSVLLMRGEDGLDEFTTTAPTRLWTVHGGEVSEAVVDAADLGVPRATTAHLRGADAAFNADVARRVLAGEGGPVRDAVVLNAGAALAARSGLQGDLATALRDGMARAAAAVDAGAAAKALDRWMSVAQALRPADE